MDVLQNLSGLEQHCPSQTIHGAVEKQSQSAPRFTTFRTIPPERVGLDGEYDHGGLAKRVGLAFSQSFAPSEIEHLRIIQRGAVVVLLGKVSNRRSLTRMINIALATSGAVDVEINGISVVQSFKSSLRSGLAESAHESTATRRDRYAKRASYAY
jgi:hypothetical protein